MQPSVYNLQTPEEGVFGTENYLLSSYGVRNFSYTGVYTSTCFLYTQMKNSVMLGFGVF